MINLKATSAIKEEVAKGLICRAPGCNDHRTIYKGEGSEYCRPHQLKLMEGLARADRAYTLHKKWSCDWCGYNPKEDLRFDRITDPVKKDRGQRASLICDHIVRRADAKAMGWTEEQIHDVTNIQTLCVICDNVKGAENDDWSKLTRKDENETN
jgi:hypothetical protein